MNIKPVYLPKTIATIVTKINDEMIARVIYQDGRVTPSDLRLTADDARRLCGAKLTSEAVIKGLAYALTSYAYKGGLPMQGIPSAIAAGITHGRSLLARGQGVDGSQLRDAILSAIDHIASLPARQIANDVEVNDANDVEVNDANDVEVNDANDVEVNDAQLLVWAKAFWVDFWAPAPAPAPAPAKTTKTTRAKTTRAKTSKAISA